MLQPLRWESGCRWRQEFSGSNARALAGEREEENKYGSQVPDGIGRQFDVRVSGV